MIRHGPGTPATPQEDVQAVLERTPTGEPPGEATHWTERAMAALCGLSPTTVQRIWRAHHLQPHRVRIFRRSTDPQFSAKLDDVVETSGQLGDPLRHGLVLFENEANVRLGATEVGWSKYTENYSADQLS